MTRKSWTLAYRLPAALFGLADTFGILFFWTTAGWGKLAGPLLMFYLAGAPVSFARKNWWLLAVLLIAYSPTYWHRLRSIFPFDELAIADAAILAVEACIVVLAIGLISQHDKGPRDKGPGSN